MDNIRVSELAKELNITSKDLIEKFAEISVVVKTHSSSVTAVQARKIREHLGLAPKKTPAKKAFIVKKTKPTEEPEVVKTTPKESVQIERIERVHRVEKAPKIEVVEKPQPKDEPPVIKKAEKPTDRAYPHPSAHMDFSR